MAAISLRNMGGVGGDRWVVAVMVVVVGLGVCGDGGDVAESRRQTLE